MARVKKELLPSVRVSPQLRRETEICAAQAGMNLGEYIRYALMERNKKIKKEIEMLQVKKSDLLEEVMECLEDGKELVVYEQSGEVRVTSVQEGWTDAFISHGPRELLCSYKFDAYDDADAVAEEDAEYALDQFLTEALEETGVEIIDQ